MKTAASNMIMDTVHELLLCQTTKGVYVAALSLRSCVVRGYK